LFREIKRKLIKAAGQEGTDSLVMRFRDIRFAPFSPVRRQLLSHVGKMLHLPFRQAEAARFYQFRF
jgi:hypothetical protein